MYALYCSLCFPVHPSQSLLFVSRRGHGAPRRRLTSDCSRLAPPSPVADMSFLKSIFHSEPKTSEQKEVDYYPEYPKDVSPLSAFHLRAESSSPKLLSRARARRAEHASSTFHPYHLDLSNRRSIITILEADRVDGRRDGVGQSVQDGGGQPQRAISRGIQVPTGGGQVVCSWSGFFLVHYCDDVTLGTEKIVLRGGSAAPAMCKLIASPLCETPMSFAHADLSLGYTTAAGHASEIAAKRKLDCSATSARAIKAPRRASHRRGIRTQMGGM